MLIVSNQRKLFKYFRTEIIIKFIKNIFFKKVLFSNIISEVKYYHDKYEI